MNDKLIDNGVDAAGITIPRALAWAILIAAVTTSLAVTATLLDMSESIVIIVTGLAVVAGCSILAAVVILCCRGAIAALRRELRESTMGLHRDITEAVAHVDQRVDELSRLSKKNTRDIRGDFTDQLDRVRSTLTQEIAAVRVHQGALVAQAMESRNQPAQRHLRTVD